MFILEFSGIRDQELVRLEGLAWSWGVSCSGPRGRGRGGWGGMDEEDAAPEENEEEPPMNINVQDVSCTVYMERNLVRGPMNAIMRGKVFSKFRLLGFSRHRTAKAIELAAAAAAAAKAGAKESGDDTHADTRTDKELVEAGELEFVPYFYLESVGTAYISSCSMGGSGGEGTLTANISVCSSDGYDFGYYNSRGRDAKVNSVDEWASALLGATVTSHRPKAAARPAEGDKPAAPAVAPVGRAPIVEYGVVQWSPVSHSHWPAEFRATVRALLLARKRVGGTFAALPRDVVHHIVSIVSREYVPSIQRFMNPNPFDSIKRDFTDL